MLLSRWRLSAFGLAQICSWGTLYYAFPQMAAAMEESLAWARSEIYGALTVGLLLAAVAAVPIGTLIDKGLGRTVMVGGSIAAGVLFLVWSQVSTVTQFYLTFSGIGLLQAAVLYTAMFAVFARHYEPEQTRGYITTLTLWGGFASTLFIPLIELLLVYLDWRTILIVLGAINIFVCGGLYSLLPHGETHEGEFLSNPEREKSPTGVAGWTLSQPVFWALVISVSAYALLENAFRFHLYPMLLENGLTKDNAVFLLALLGPAQVVGRVLLKFFQNTNVILIGRVVFTVIPTALLLVVVFPESAVWLGISIVAYGAAAGVMTIVFGMAVPELMSRTSYGLINGMLNVPRAVLQAFGPTIAALIWAAFGGYQTLMAALVAFGVMASLAFALASVLKIRTHSSR
ncbi:MAG: MFS transporter [Pseudomonadota bacterium]